MVEQTYQLEEHVDCLDSVNKWCDAVIAKRDPTKIFVTFPGFAKKYDEWIESDSPRLQKQWRPGQIFRLNNRLDVLDKKSVWLEATVVDIKLLDEVQVALTVHFKGFNPKWDETLNLQEPAHTWRIKPVGTFSKGSGWAKFDKEFLKYTRQKVDRDSQQTISAGSNKNTVSSSIVNHTRSEVRVSDPENELRRLMKDEKGWKIIEIDRDGNCLFRAVAHQVYGTQEVHSVVRSKCMEYIKAGSDYFRAFIADENIESYVARKAVPGVWGDEVELQALSETYNRPIEIYTSATQPMRTFHEQSNGSAAVRLSYHGNNHYNSVVPLHWSPTDKFELEEAGTIESEAIQAQTVLVKEGPVEVVLPKLNPQFLAENYKQTLQKSRDEFELQSKLELEKVIENSQTQSKDSLSKFTQEINQAAHSATSLEEQQLSQAILQSEEQQLIEAMQHSSVQDEDEILRQMLLDSQQEFEARDDISPVVLEALQFGFSVEQAIQAESIVGSSPDNVVAYLFRVILTTHTILYKLDSTAGPFKAVGS